MSQLSDFLAEQILMEESKIKKTVVVYVGRFQPMHKGHFKTFQHLQKKFGKADVYIGTSNKTEKGRSPFNFKEKVKIMTTMFGIPKSKIVQVKNPYNPQEVLKRFNKETTAFVTVVGQKDASRLSHKYFQKYDGNPTEGYEDRGYLYVAPMQGGSVSGTEVRQGLSMGSDDQKEKFFKDRAYGKFNKTIFQMVTDKLSEGLFVPKEIIEEYMMEISTGGLGGQDVDDGPNFFIPNYKTFRKVAADRAAKLGYTVVNMIGDEKFEDYYEHPEYPDGPQTAVSYFPAGVIGTMTPNNQIDIYSSDAYSNWYKHVTRKAAMIGYDVIKKLDVNKDDKDQSTDDAKGAKDLEQEFEASLTEMIKLPVKVGDTILMGRFKNKKVVVKSIGKDEHGMPTINGKKVVTFRLMKEGFEVELQESCDRPMKGETEQQFRTRCFGINPLAQPPKGLMRVGEDSNPNAHPQGKNKLTNRTTVMDMLDVISHKEFRKDYDKLSDSQKKKVLKVAKQQKFIKEDVDERSKGKLRPADLLRRKAAMAGKRAQIARRRARTMKRRKPLAKLKKIAYKKAYLQVYDEFMKDLFPGMKKKDLSIQQAKIVHKNVLRKKKRVQKRARFRFLPALRAKEADKFDGKEAARIPRKKGQHRNSSSHSDLYTDENPKGTIKGLKFATVDDAKKSVSKIKSSGKSHAHKIQAAVAMEQRAKEMGKKSQAAVYRAYINKMKKKTKAKNETLGYPSKEDMKKINQRLDNQRKNTDSNKEYQYHTIKENINESKLLMEGGAYGHMNHPFDSDVNLTFGQLKDIVNRALDGTLENTREKTDGQALAISWRDNRLVAARNKGHLKNKGENALDIKGVSDKFQGRGGLSDAYNFAMRDLSKAISSLSEKQREKVFKGGACFMNLEVIYPTSVNVVPYGQALLVFHGTMEYDEEGVAIGENQGAARVLAGMIKQVNQNVQSSYTIEGPPVVKLPKSQDLSKKKSVYSGKIKRLQKKYNLKDTDGVAEYHQAFWENYVDKKSPTTLDNKTKMGLVKRWAFFDKKFRLDSKNISDSKTLDWAKKTDKEKHSKIAKDNIRPFEDIFLGLGAEVLQFVSSALTVNPDKAIRDMKKRLDKTIKDVKKSGDEKKIQKLKLELQRLNSIGGAKKIVPNEGIVFTYNGKTFKLTGTFAPLNQILGIFF
tara:strand:- start:1438 stop:4947 length:3510 start_codon:yes stop_codon:yes gene_type:complete